MDHEKILTVLDITPAHASEYRQLKEENEQLKRNPLFILSRKIEGFKKKK